MAEYSERIRALLAKMTLEEKAGQLNFLVGDLFMTGPTMKPTQSNKFDEQIKSGEITGLFNIYGAEYVYRLQKIAIEESRLGIPLLIGADVIHGLKTIFPIPLAEAASWNLDLMEQTARAAARESTAVGINFNFAPMCDIGLDARWGRVAEGAGEDPYLVGEISAARVKGFQGNDLKLADTLAACVKHIAAYGAPEAGRDYNTVDMSERKLRQTYLPAYKKALEAGAATVMSSFNDLNGVPCTGNEFLLKKILREEWGFDGMVVSDWASVAEIESHGVANDLKDATKQALLAGTDMDMMAEGYFKHIPELVNSGELPLQLVDESVLNVLALKEKLGLFENPFLYGNFEREKLELRSKENLELSRKMAEESIVLLKNSNNLLPLRPELQKVCLIGPLGDNKADMNGTWSFFADPEDPVTMLEGLKLYQPDTTFSLGCELYESTERHFNDALEVAKQSDVIILALGESAVMNGEAASRADIGLPENQLDLFNTLHSLEKPVIVLVSAGRPLVLTELESKADAILLVWSLGSMAGDAIANIVFGQVNPSAKLPITFPRHSGQVPMHYQLRNTGRPYLGDYSEPKSERIYQSKYRDVENGPLYPFGYGLSYTSFAYGEPVLSKSQMKISESIRIGCQVKNVGHVTGEEIVQLYIRDVKASVTRPLKELKGFQKIKLQPNEEKTVEFKITNEHLAFYRRDMSYGSEPGEFQIFVGPNSETQNSKTFELID